MITEENVGIGQLFQKLSVLPQFKLVNLGKTDRLFWRDYILEYQGIICQIREEFPVDLYKEL